MIKPKKKKRCSKCKKMLLVDEFFKRKASPNGLCYKCKDCMQVAHQKYSGTEKSKVASRKSRLKYKFGIAPEQYDKLFKRQNGCCAICKVSQSNLKRRLDIDHDHKTGKVRGLLCISCTRRLGHIPGWYANSKKIIDQYLKGKK